MGQANQVLTFTVELMHLDSGSIDVVIRETQAPRDPPRILSGRPNDAWLLAQHAGDLIGLRIQEALIQVRGANPAPVPPSEPSPKKRSKKKAAKRKTGRKVKKRK